MPDYNPLPTVKILDPETGNMIIINESDYDPSTSVLWVEPVLPVEPAPKSSAPKKS